MNPFIEYTKIYFADHPPECGYEDIHSLLGVLCQLYTAHNPIVTERIDLKLAQLEPALRTLSRKRLHRVRHVMEEMCTEHEQEAFLTGIRVGIQLFAELTEL